MSVGLFNTPDHSTLSAVPPPVALNTPVPLSIIKPEPTLIPPRVPLTPVPAIGKV